MMMMMQLRCGFWRVFAGCDLSLQEEITIIKRTYNGHQQRAPCEQIEIIEKVVMIWQASVNKSRQ